MKKLLAMIPLLAATQAHASVMTISLNDIGTFSALRNSNTASTYAGTGYLGMYSTAWAHVLGVERSNLSRTVMQVDIGALAGKTISSAVLSFELREGENASQNGTLVGFDADANAGKLAFSWNAPGANYGSVVSTLAGRAVSYFDVTGLLRASLAAGDSWFGMHLRGSTLAQWTVANSGGYAADRAGMVLTVNYRDAAGLPEPGSLLLMGAGMAALVLLRLRRVTRLRR
jgi:hypothetical protein